MAGRPHKLSPEAIQRIRRWYQEWLRMPSMTEMAKREGVNINTLRAAAIGHTHKTVWR